MCIVKTFFGYTFKACTSFKLSCIIIYTILFAIAVPAVNFKKVLLST